jgi:hypothetical protein
LLAAVAAASDDGSVTSSTDVLEVLRKHIGGDGDPELDHALISLQFLLRSRWYLKRAWRTRSATLEAERLIDITERDEVTGYYRHAPRKNPHAR